MAESNTRNSGCIDVHHHISPDFYNKLIGRQAAPVSATNNAGGARHMSWTPADSIEEMDREGVATSVTTIAAAENLWNLPDAAASIRRCNEYQAEMMRDYPGRFGMFAVMPLEDIDASLREMEYALDVLHADGMYVCTRFRDIILGDEYYAPLFDELNRRKAVLYTHPVIPTTTQRMTPVVADATIEIVVDTTRALANVLFGGFAARYPDVQIIWSHGGGTMPMVIDRFLDEAAKPRREEALPRGLMPELARFWYDTAQAHRPAPLAALRNVVPLSQIVFGTDHPHRTPKQISDGLAQCNLSATELRAIERENALRLLPNQSAVKV